MKKRLSLLMLVTGLFIAGATFTAKAGDEKKDCKAKTSCSKDEAKKCDDTKKAEKKSDESAK